VKICTKCGLEKFESDFFVKDRRTGRLHAQCKLCYKEHRQTYYSHHYATYRDLYLKRAKVRRDKLRAEFRSNMLDYLSDKACVDCGEDDIRVLELDHIHPEQKNFNISQAVKFGYSWEEVLTEMAKCRILCANCHKRRTAQQFSWYKAV
jgi:5-methylcytosine-specific restriction endonuclease McrA